MSHWEQAHGLFAYELAMGVIIHAVSTGQMSKEAASALIDDVRTYLSTEKPSQTPLFAQIAAKATAQLELLSLAVRRGLERGA